MALLKTFAGRWRRRSRATPSFVCIGLSVLVGLLASVLEAQSKPSREYEIKAAFLFNFAQFVEWPATAFEDANSPICIGVLGDDPFGATLEEIVRGETIGARQLTIRRSKKPEDFRTCHLLFISRSERAHIGTVLLKLGPEPILTVSEVEGFAADGGIINFRLEGNKVRFEINPSAARREGLRISSQLLSLGEIVDAAPAE